MFQSKFIFLLAVLFAAGCAQKERAGDITLATPSPAQSTLSQSVNNNSAAAVSSAKSAIVGTNLTTDYSAGVSAGSVSPKTDSGIRMPAATSSPVATPAPITSSDTVAMGSSSEAASSTHAKNVATAAISPNTSSSSLIEGSKVPARSITIVRTKPDCSGAECPSIKVKRLSFIGREKFNNFLDQTMAFMAEIDASNNAAFRTLAEFASYFWKISKPGYQVVLEASVKRGDEDLVVVQLDSYIFTGGAHGLSTTQYINWLPKTDKILSLESMLLPKKMADFEQVLKKQHAIWLKSNPQAIENPAAYNKLWPFVPTDNAALLADGLALTYDPYSIAPYSFGRPTITIPYSELNGILRPELLP